MLGSKKWFMSPTGIEKLIRTKRIVIVGRSGAGKTTLGRQLETILWIPFIESPHDVIDDIKRTENWILHGDHGLGQLAEVVIDLDFPVWLCLWRVTRRSIDGFLRLEFYQKGGFFGLCHRVFSYCRCIGEVLWFPFSRKEHREEVQRASVYTILLRTCREVEDFLVAVERALER